MSKQNPMELYELAVDNKAAIMLEYNRQREGIMAQIAEQLADLDAEFQPSIEAADQALAQSETELKAAVLIAGSTQKGKFTTAVYNKPRVSWDTAALDGFAAAHPEIQPFRKAGQPSVTLRTVAQKGG